MNVTITMPKADTGSLSLEEHTEGMLARLLKGMFKVHNIVVTSPEPGVCLLKVDVEVYFD